VILQDAASEDLSTAAVIGIAVAGGVVGIGGIGAAVYFIYATFFKTAAAAAAPATAAAVAMTPAAAPVVPIAGRLRGWNRMPREYDDGI
jgi:hypothetical protein